MLKRFYYASAAVLMLALAYHLGATTAIAQAPSNPVVAAVKDTGASQYFVVFTANGDVYGCSSGFGGPWVLLSNVFSGPTPARQTSWGALKGQSR